MILSDILWISKSVWNENFPSRCVSVIFIRKSWIFVCIPTQIFSCGIHIRFFSQFRRCFTSGSWKGSENETVATFYDVCGVFGSKNDQFSLLRSDWKLFSILKQKWKRFVKGNSQKREADHFGSIWPQISSVEMKSVFPRFPSRNLAQTRTLGDILLYVIS